jgi:hypothetical protein
MDGLKVVTLSAGGRPVMVADIEDGTTYTLIRGTFKYTPAQRRQQTSQRPGRYGGGWIVSDGQDNAQVGGTWLVAGTTADQVNANTEALLALVDYAGVGRLIEWTPDGATRPVYPELRGPGTYTPQYEWVEYAGAQLMKVEISFPCAPLPLLLPMDIGDDFSVDSLADYTADAGSKADLAIAGGVLTATGNLTAEKALYHSVRGHSVGDHEETLKFTPGATITSFKAGVRLKRTASNQYLEVYVDDNGTNSRLRIDKLVGGVRTNLASTNLATRLSNGTAGWVRGRIEGNVVSSEYFTAAPTPMGAPTLAPAAYTLTGGEIAAFGSAATGGRGFSWIPQHASAALDDYASLPYTRRNVTLPQSIQLVGDVPGRAPALCDIVVTPSGGAAAPIWALVAWSKRPGAPLASSVAPFGIIEAESASDLSGWAVLAAGAARGGSVLQWTTSGAGAATASWLIDPATLVADEFTQGELDLEVWARVAVDAAVVSPKLTLSVRPESGTSFGAERFTHEWGSAGKLLVKPSSGVPWRPVRLGTLTVAVNPLTPRRWKLWLAGAVASGSSGGFYLDYLPVVVARQRALGPTSEPNDSSYPKFVSSTSETTKRVRSDLSAVVAAPPAYGHADHGLGGSLLEIPSGPVDALVKLSSVVPDDPTVNTADEQLAHSATVHFAVTPRVRLLNG